jgi:transposase
MRSDRRRSRAGVLENYTMKEIAVWFGVHYATVSQLLNKAEYA